MPLRVAIVPAGQWGAALAVPLAANGHAVRLWLRRPGAAAEFARTGQHFKLPQTSLGPGVTAFDSPADALQGADLVLLAPSSQAVADVCQAIAPHLPPAAAVVSVTKGLEAGTGRRISEVIAGCLPAVAGRLAVLSGPNFAVEVARQLPTGTVVAAPDHAVAEFAQGALMTTRFRVYTHDDVIGVELGGALKNIIAIGVGISDGLGMGHNARAALITRGLAEMARLGTAMGANQMTFAGLSGIGDLVLTCTGDLSRNRQAGLALGRGEPPAGVLGHGVTIEGAPATRAAQQLATQHGVDMPITRQIHAMLFEGVPAPAALEALMGRGRTQEWG